MPSARVLLTRALHGDKAAAIQLRADLNRAAKRANRRLLNLERAGLTDSPAYQLAVQDITQIRRRRPDQRLKRFPETNKSLKLVEVEAMLNIAQSFLNRQTSTPSGYRKNIKNRLNFIREMGVDIRGRESKFLEFMSTNWFNEFVKFDSGQTFQEIDKMIEEDVTPEQIEAIFDQYTQGEIDFMDATYSWEEYVNPSPESK